MPLNHGGDWAGFAAEYGCLPLDFSSNVSPLGLPEGVKRAVAAALERADRYPDPLCRGLIRALADRHGLPEDRIVCGNGAADLLYRIALALRPRTALLPAPTFSEYALALEAAGTTVKRFPLAREDGFRTPPSLAEAIQPGLDLLVLCEPNNPTGRTTDPALLEKIIRRCRENGVRLLIDECFIPFLEDPAAHSSINRLAANENLILLRAFTKWYAMAGLRLGYALCGSSETARRLREFGPPWAVSLPAQEAGVAALREKEYDAALRGLIREGRRQLLSGLTELGMEVIPGEANFLLFFSRDASLCEKLRPKGILLRDCRNFAGLGVGWYRTAIRTEEENNALLAALSEVIHD